MSIPRERVPAVRASAAKLSGNIAAAVSTAVDRSVTRAIDGYVFLVAAGFYNGKSCPTPTTANGAESLSQRLERTEVLLKATAEAADKAIKFDDFVQLQNKVDFDDKTGNYGLRCLDRPSEGGLQMWNCRGDGNRPDTSSPAQTFRLLKRGSWQPVKH